MIKFRVGAFLDYYYNSRNDKITIVSNKEQVFEGTKLDLFTSHSPFLENDVKGFDFGEDGNIIIDVR